MVAPATAKTTGTRCGRPCASTVASRATRAAAKRVRACSPVIASPAGELGDRVLPALQRPLHPGPRTGRQPVRHPPYPGHLRPLQLRRVGRHADELDLHRTLRPRAQLPYPGQGPVPQVGEPSVAERQDPVQHARPVPPDEHRRGRALDRLRVGQDPVEADVLAVVARLRLGPDRPHRLDPFPHQGHAGTRVGAVVGHLPTVPAGAHAELQPPAGQVVHAGHRLGRGDRVAFDDQADPAAHAQPRGGRGRRGQRHEQVVAVPVLGRQRLPVVAPRRVGGDVRVLGEEQRVLAVLLDQPGHRAGSHAVVCREVPHPEVHDRALPFPAPSMPPSGCPGRSTPRRSRRRHDTVLLLDVEPSHAREVPVPTGKTLITVVALVAALAAGGCTDQPAGAPALPPPAGTLPAGTAAPAPAPTEAAPTATFFLTGDFVARYADAARQIARAGHPIGNHSATHPPFAGLAVARVRAEITGAAQSIHGVTGVDPRPLFRFPFGSKDARAVATVNGLGYVAVRWTVDAAGWQGTMNGTRTVAYTIDRVLAAVTPGMIVLMHVGSHPTDHSTLDADALPAVITGLRARGYTFVTLRSLWAAG